MLVSRVGYLVEDGDATIGRWIGSSVCVSVGRRVMLKVVV